MMQFWNNIIVLSSEDKLILIYLSSPFLFFDLGLLTVVLIEDVMVEVVVTLQMSPE